MSAAAAREFLFAYRFGGSEWVITIHAADAAEAREKIKAVALARYDGELMARIPAVPGGGLLARLICWIKSGSGGAHER